MTAAARELARYKLDLVGVQGVRWDKETTVRAKDCNFFYGKGNENHQFHLSIRRAIKQTLLIVGHITFVNFIQILSNILLSKLTPYEEQIIGDNQCGFRCNRTAADHILCICQIMERNGNKTQQCISSS